MILKIYIYELFSNREMKTFLTFNIIELIQKINTKEEFYEILEKDNFLIITKKYNNKRGRSFTINLPKEIKISSEAVGLIVGEGYIGDRSFTFANSNKVAITEIIYFLKQFGLPIKNYLEISVKNKYNGFDKECKIFWEKYLKINIRRIRLRKEFDSITNHGTIHLTVNNSLVAKILELIINKSKLKIEKSKILSIDYLKGIIAAEGNINVKKTTNCVYMVRISAKKQKERDHYKICLEKAGLKVYCKDMKSVSKLEAKQRGWKTDKGRAGAVIISRWENFIKIFELDLLNLHEEKKDKFIENFINNKFTKEFLDFGYFIDKSFTMKEAQIYFNFKGRSVSRILAMEKRGYINRKRLNNLKFTFKLTNRYLQIYNKLNEELKLHSFPLLKSSS
jgi:hypothetical protein